MMWSLRKATSTRSFAVSESIIGQINIRENSTNENATELACALVLQLDAVECMS